MTSPKPFIKLTLTLALAALVIFSLNSTAAAQDAEPDAPTRAASNQPAPDRQPTLLRRDAQPDGALNTVIELPAIADTYIASGEPDRPFGGNQLLYLGFSANEANQYGAERILLRFNVDSIPDTATINSARVRLYLFLSVPDDDGDMNTVIRRLNSDWDESFVTWNTEPQWATIRDDTSVGSTPQFYEWDITDLVKSWVAGDLPNYGVEIEGDERPDLARERVFRSRVNDSFFPRLVVDYDESSDNRAPQISVEPLPDFSGRDFEVKWSGDDVGSSGIDYYDVQYRLAPEGDDNDGDWVDWQMGTEETSEDFNAGKNGRRYEFRARGVDNAGNVQPFGDAQAATIVDTLAPVARVTGPSGIIRSGGVNDTFTVTWEGLDSDGLDDNVRVEGSGIDHYDVQYRIDNGEWILWQNETQATSAPFLPREEDAVYFFEARAVDRRGQAEPFRNVPEVSVAVDRQAPFIEPQLLLPIVAFSE